MTPIAAKILIQVWRNTADELLRLSDGKNTNKYALRAGPHKRVALEERAVTLKHCADQLERIIDDPGNWSVEAFTETLKHLTSYPHHT